MRQDPLIVAPESVGNNRAASRAFPSFEFGTLGKWLNHAQIFYMATSNHWNLFFGFYKR